MKKIMKATKIVAKIIEIAHWIGVGFMTAIAICTAVAPQLLGKLLDTNMVYAEAYGFTIVLLDGNGEFSRTAYCLFAVSAVFLCALVAMIFRNINLIIKKAEASTPFHKDNIRRMREIGIFSIAIPVVGLVMSVITRIVVGWAGSSITISLDGFVMGIIVLSLTQFFTYGAELENDTEGLL